MICGLVDVEFLKLVMGTGQTKSSDSQLILENVGDIADPLVFSFWGSQIKKWVVAVSKFFVVFFCLESESWSTVNTSFSSQKNNGSGSGRKHREEGALDKFYNANINLATGLQAHRDPLDRSLDPLDFVSGFPIR